MSRPRFIQVLTATLLTPAVALAAPPAARDPDWPCQQIKVPELSLTAAWSGPAVDPQQIGWKDDPAIADLVPRLALRRDPVEHAQSLIHDFAQHSGDRKHVQLLQVLVGVFSVLGEERNSVLAGLDRFGRRQQELAEQVRADNEALRALQMGSLQTGVPPDTQAIEQQTQKVTWEAQVFQDRRQALSYACEVPGKIDQRWFALSQQIQRELQ